MDRRMAREVGLHLLVGSRKVIYVPFFPQTARSL
jgi:hypothetical protein